MTPHKGDALYNAQDVSRDAKTLYYTSDGGREYTALYAMDLDSARDDADRAARVGRRRRWLHARLEILLLQRHQRRRAEQGRSQGRGRTARP